LEISNKFLLIILKVNYLILDTLIEFAYFRSVMDLDLVLLESTYSIYRLDRDASLPDWIYLSDFYTITKTGDELSVVACQNASFPELTKASKDWRILKVMGPLDLSLIGVIAGITEILKQGSISVFTISSYETDYFLVKQTDLNKAILALKEHGYRITEENNRMDTRENQL
jgi:hypothetical protein